MQESHREFKRLALQSRLDSEKSQAERNRLGQFATPTTLAQEIVQFGVDLLKKKSPIRYFDPAFGTGSFFSALLHIGPVDRIKCAKGFELDNHYGKPARKLWRDTPLELELTDFTQATPPIEEKDRFNLLICNPPYVRHHHVSNNEKKRLQDVTKVICGVRIAGLAGLYCYFIGLSHGWLQRGAIAGWLIPSEFMDVNYGMAIKRYLLNKVTLIRIHRFDPNDLQFDDALVSSAIVWFRNDPPSENHSVQFTFGGSLLSPNLSRDIPDYVLQKETKWTRFPILDVRKKTTYYRLADFFTIKRGLVTGDNKFFILSKDQIKLFNLPYEVFRPILPSPRYVSVEEIESEADGTPLIDRRLFLLDCRLSEVEVKERHPKLWAYLENGKGEVSKRYLCRSRKVWYFQEERQPAPILCTYIGRSDVKSGRPFRFILNNSKATAANSYLLLYPKPVLEREMAKDKTLLRKVWEALKGLRPSALLEEGRVYGGGLHKLEPNELANVDATPILDTVPSLRLILKPIQLHLFEQVTA